MPFLRNHMIWHCCKRNVGVAYLGDAELWEKARGQLSFEEARLQLNKYTSNDLRLEPKVPQIGC